MAAKKKDAELIDLVLNEAMRQDSLVHQWATALGTKAALYMVFAGFVFTAETEIVKLASGPVARAILCAALFLSLLGVIPLLSASFLYLYKKPLRPTKLRERFMELETLLIKEKVPEEDRILTFKDKLANSYSRCVDENSDINEKIANKLEWAALLLGLSIGALVLLVLVLSMPTLTNL